MIGKFLLLWCWLWVSVSVCLAPPTQPKGQHTHTPTHSPHQPPEPSTARLPCPRPVCIKALSAPFVPQERVILKIVLALWSQRSFGRRGGGAREKRGSEDKSPVEQGGYWGGGLGCYQEGLLILGGGIGNGRAAA